jgi:hypothetical protein
MVPAAPAVPAVPQRKRKTLRSGLPAPATTRLTPPYYTRAPKSISKRIWYFLYSGSLVFFIPYIPLFLKRDLHWEPWRVG